MSQISKNIKRNPFAAFGRWLTGYGVEPYIRSRYQAIPKQADVLMIGCGDVMHRGPLSGIIYDYQDSHNLNITSFDIDAAKNPDIVGDIAAYDFGSKQFDIVIMVEVLEHVAEPKAACGNLYRILKPGGQLILTCPFLFPIHLRPHDYYRYTSYGLAHLLQDFEDVDIKARTGWGHTLLALLSRFYAERSLRYRLFSPFAVSVCFILYPLFWVLERLFPHDFITLGYLVSARKAR